MRQLRVSIPKLILIAGTRVVLGIGVGLLLAERLHGRRRAVGLALLGFGVLSTIPLAAEVLPERAAPNGEHKERRLPEERL
jgi:hypothetical protein